MSASPIVVFTALDWEAQVVATALGARGPDVLCADGSAVQLVRCGVGMRSAMAAAKAVPAARCFVTVGCAGALQSSLRTGDLVVASAVGLVDPEGVVQSHWPAAEAGVAAAAQRQDIAVQVGTLLSSPVVIVEAARKAALAASGALAVDMESAAVMGVALQRGIPFVGLRIILDEAHETLPSGLDAVDEAGAIRFGRALLGAARHPRAMMRLARQQAQCERRLREVLPALLRGDALGFPPAARVAADA